MPKRLGRSIGPAMSTAPPAPTAGQQYYDTATGEWMFYSGVLSAWVATGPHTFRTVHTFSIGGTIGVTAGDTNYVPPFFVSLSPGQTMNIVKARYRLNTGSATFSLLKNGTSLTGYTGLSATTTPTSTTSTQALVEDDYVGLSITAATGAFNLSVTMSLEHTIIS